MELPKDPMILEFYEEFVDTWINDVNEQYDGFLANKDKDNFYRFAHTLKGSGYQFEIQPLGDKGIELMALIKEEKWDETIPYKQILLDILTEAKKLYQDSQK
jgi:hypothetical protein